MEIKSPAFISGGKIPVDYTCDGKNVNPPLEFKGVPEGTKSLVLIVEDADAWHHSIHWLVFNIPALAKGFQEHSYPDGAVQGVSSKNMFSYFGPCSNEKEHEYLFKLYALDIELDIPAASDVHVVLFEMSGHVIAEAMLTGKYHKKAIPQVMHQK